MIGIAITCSHHIGQAPDLLTWLVNLIPTNPLTALSTSNLLQTTLQQPSLAYNKPKHKPFAESIASVYDISDKILIVVLCISPMGIFALTAAVMAKATFGVISNLFNYVFDQITDVVLMILVYTILLLAFKISPKQFFSSFTSTLYLEETSFANPPGACLKVRWVSHYTRVQRHLYRPVI